MRSVFADKVRRVLARKLDSAAGRLLHDLDETLEAMASRPFELHLELTNPGDLRRRLTGPPRRSREVDWLGLATGQLRRASMPIGTSP